MASKGEERVTLKEASKAETVTLEQFIDLQQKDRDDNNQACKDAYKTWLRNELDKLNAEDKPLHPDKDKRKKKESSDLWQIARKKISGSLKVSNAFREGVISEESLEDLLNGEAKLRCSKEESLDVEKKEIWKTVYNVIAEYQGLAHEAFLLLNAPGPEDESLSSDLDRDARDIHLQDFYSAVVGDKDKDKYPVWTIVVDKYADVKGTVEDFLKGQASRSKRATIVYNGHGKTSGKLHLRCEDNNPTNTELLQDIYQLWDNHKGEHVESDDKVLILPSKVTVVLAQCYGFMYNLKPKEKQVIDVVSLSTPKTPRTKFEYEMKENFKGDEYIATSVHVELAGYARRLSEENVESPLCTNHSPNFDLSPTTSRPSSSSSSLGDYFVPSLMFVLALPPEVIPESTRASDKTEALVTNSTKLSQRWKGGKTSIGKRKKSPSKKKESPRAIEAMIGGLHNIQPTDSPKSPAQQKSTKPADSSKSPGATTMIGSLMNMQLNDSSGHTSPTKSKEKDKKKLSLFSGKK